MIVVCVENGAACRKSNVLRRIKRIDIGVADDVDIDAILSTRRYRSARQGRKVEREAGTRGRKANIAVSRLENDVPGLHER